VRSNQGAQAEVCQYALETTATADYATRYLSPQELFQADSVVVDELYSR
jgi:hypothetical protein